MTDISRLSWEELEVVEHENGGLMFPATVRSRTRTGAVKEEPCMVRFPTPLERMQCRQEATAFLADDCKLDLKQQKELDQEYLRALFDRAEDLCVLAKSLRTRDAPYPQLAAVDELASKYDPESLKDIKERISYFEQLLDPRDAIVTEDQFWRKVREVVRKRNLLPLADIAGHELPSFMLRMAQEASRSPNAPSLPPSSETSTADS